MEATFDSKSSYYFMWKHDFGLKLDTRDLQDKNNWKLQQVLTKILFLNNAH